MNKDILVQKISNILSQYNGIRAALLFGSYYYIKLNYIEKILENELSIKFDLCNIDNLSKTLKEELIVSQDNVIYLKDNNWSDWLGYVDYLI